MIHGELIIDNFAGGGGASTGIELATGYSVDIAINHDPEAIRMHKMNHPNTKHYCEDVWQVDPVSERLPEDERDYLVTLKKAYGEPEIFCGIANYLKFGEAIKIVKGGGV